MSAADTRTRALIIAGVITFLLVNGLANLSYSAQKNVPRETNGSESRATATCWLSDCSLV